MPEPLTDKEKNDAEEFAFVPPAGAKRKYVPPPEPMTDKELVGIEERQQQDKKALNRANRTCAMQDRDLLLAEVKRLREAEPSIGEEVIEGLSCLTEKLNAVAAEREACAALLETLSRDAPEQFPTSQSRQALEFGAEAIRARGDADD